MVKQLRGVWPQVYKMPSCQMNSTSSLINLPIHDSLLSSSLIYLSASLYDKGPITSFSFFYSFFRFQNVRQDLFRSSM